MMFPVNRTVTELTQIELLNLYDEKVVDAAKQRGLEREDTVETLKELRSEIERRMAPCNRQHFHPLQTSGYQQALAQQQGLQQSDPIFRGNR